MAEFVTSKEQFMETVVAGFHFIIDAGLVHSLCDSTGDGATKECGTRAFCPILRLKNLYTKMLLGLCKFSYKIRKHDDAVSKQSSYVKCEKLFIFS